MEYDVKLNDLAVHPVNCITTQASRYFAGKLEERLLLALQKALGLEEPLKVEDVKKFAHKMLCVHTPDARWYYVDGECFYGHKVVKFDVDWEGGKATFVVEELPVEDAPACTEAQS